VQSNRTSRRLARLLLTAALLGLQAPPALRAEDALASRPRPVVAVVLSGGAALGFAHVGVLKVIEEIGIPVDMVVGASMGAIVGGLYAAGYSPSDMESIAGKVDWQPVFNDAIADSPYSYREKEVAHRYPFTLGFGARGFWAGRGLLAGRSITTLLELLTVNVSTTEDFDLLPRRFRAVAADITTGEQVVLGRGRLADAIRASATIPLLFKPFTLDGRQLVDGGIVDRLPTDVARKLGADIVIAVEVNESPAGAPADLQTMFDVVGQVSRVLMESNTSTGRALADLVITPDMTGFRRLDFDRAPRIITRGEAEARKYIKELSALARRVAETRPLEPSAGRVGPYLGSANLPVAHSLQVTGAFADNEQVVRRIFAPLLNAPLHQGQLRDAVDEAYQTGRFEEIRFGLSPAAPGDPAPAGDPAPGAPGLVVETVPLAPPTVAALLGVRYKGDVSQTLVNSLVLSPGIIVRDLSGKGSQLIVDSRLVDSLGAGMEYFQPLGRRFFVDGFFRYLLSRDLFLQGDGAQVGRLDSGPAAGVWTGFLLGQSTEIKAGLSWSARRYLDPALTVAENTTASVARFLVAVDTRPAAVFPSRGFGIALGYDQALTELGGSESWKKLSLDAAALVPVTHLLTVGLTLSGGTDFTQARTDPGVLRPADAFSLRTEAQFRGYQEWEVRGSHKIAGSLDLQLRLPALGRLLGTDFYVLGSVSAGTCWTDLGQVAAQDLHYGGDVGIGVRVLRDFGVSARACYVDSGRYQLSVDLGSFAMNDAPGLVR
jgi:NTE family protein